MRQGCWRVHDDIPKSAQRLHPEDLVVSSGILPFVVSVTVVDSPQEVFEAASAAGLEALSGTSSVLCIAHPEWARR